MIVDSHVVYTSGKHGSAYINKDAIYPNTEDTSALCEAIAEKFRDDGISTVIAPAIGGVILSQWTAYHLTRLSQRRVNGVYAEKAADGESFVIKRGYDRYVGEGWRVLVVEDILTTGGSAKKVIEAVRALGGRVVALAAICNRGGVTAEDVGGVPELFALTNVNLDTYEEAECPLCAQGIEINTEVGKGKELLGKKGITKCPVCRKQHLITDCCPK